MIPVLVYTSCVMFYFADLLQNEERQKQDVIQKLYVIDVDAIYQLAIYIIVIIGTILSLVFEIITLFKNGFRT